jgi:periplasmic protein TonB
MGTGSGHTNSALSVTGCGSGDASAPMFHDETNSENHLERSTPLQSRPAPPAAEEQRKRMLIALGLLLMALAAVVVKDWDFWFPPNEEQEATYRSRSKTPVAAPATVPSTPAGGHKTVKAVAPAPAAEAPFSATTERAVLPPLQVEVVAGNRHIAVPAKSNAIHLDVDSGATSSASGAPATGVNAAGTQLSPQATQNVTVSVAPDYPLLARQMKVQGAVSLQALISRDGTIQELQILSGPAILAAAAREAVKQWHFKPYLQNGQAVETQARITVNFTISTN